MMLGIGLRQGPRGLRFLVSEVPLYTPLTFMFNVVFRIFSRVWSLGK